MRSITNFFVRLSGICLILYVQITSILFSNSNVDVATMFAVVSIISSLQTPMKGLVTIIYNYYGYTYAKRSLSYFLFKVEDKPNEAEVDPLLPAGTICLIKLSSSI